MVSAANMVARTYVCTCSWCGDILMTVSELCLQTSTEAKIDINPNILRNIVEVMEEGI